MLSLQLSLSNQDALQTSTPGVQMLKDPSAPVGANMSNNTKRQREKRERLMFKSVCERECWIQVFVWSAHTGGLSEQ